MAPRKNAGSVFMPTKVKRLMQADKEVGKMVAEVPIVMACAVEMLLSDILKAANNIRLQGTTKLLTAAHLEQVMNQNPEYVAVRPPLDRNSIPLHPHEFIAKYSKQSYFNSQQKPFGLDPAAHQMQQQQQHLQYQQPMQQMAAYGHVIGGGTANPMIGGTATTITMPSVGLAGHKDAAAVLSMHSNLASYDEEEEEDDDDDEEEEEEGTSNEGNE